MKYTILGVLFILNGCGEECIKKEIITEEKTVIIKGTIYDAITQLPLKAIKIKTYSYISIYAGCHCCDERILISDTISDENGIFEIRTKTIKTNEKEVIHFELEISRDNYIPKLEIIDNKLIQDEISYKKDININPASTLLINVKNINPYDSSDWFNYFYREYSFGYTTSSSIIFYGTDIDEKIIEKRYGNRYNQISWSVGKNGITNSYVDSIYCTALDTIIFNINY